MAMKTALLVDNIKIFFFLIQASGEDLGPFVTMLREKDEETNQIEDGDEETDELARQPRVIGTASRYIGMQYRKMG